MLSQNDYSEDHGDHREHSRERRYYGCLATACHGREEGEIADTGAHTGCEGIATPRKNSLVAPDAGRCEKEKRSGDNANGGDDLKQFRFNVFAVGELRNDAPDSPENHR